MSQARTMFDKIWSRHVVAEGGGGLTLLYITRHLVHDGTFHPFEMIEEEGRKVRRPDLTFATPDHYVPTRNRGAHIADPEVRTKMETLERNAAAHGFVQFGMHDPRQGIVHVVGPEQGITLPGTTLVCGDSHTCSHGALGCLSIGIGASEVSHVLATQTMWHRKPKVMRITVDGALPLGVAAKDVILAIIAKIGVGGGSGHALEYAGSTIRSLSIAGRLTLCNMSIEAGARTGMVAPDDTTYAYLEGRPFAPKGRDWDKALAHWRTLPSDAAAVFDREVSLNAADLAPTVTWGTSPQDAAPITARIPDPASFADAGRRAAAAKSLNYMGLTPGTPIAGIAIDRAFIGSCTNGRLEDLRIAAGIVKGRKAAVPTLVVPGSGLVKQAAEAEGLDRIFLDAGCEWGDAGCSMCMAINGDTVPAGLRAASTSNRNFEGRQGKGARTHLMSPAMVAAAAVTGRLTDVRSLEN